MRRLRFLEHWIQLGTYAAIALSGGARLVIRMMFGVVEEWNRGRHDLTILVA